MSYDLEFDPALLTRYDVPGPRYTSYPTAPHFRTDFGEAQYRAQARASNDDPIPRPLSLYAHIPFCPSPCFYCGCTRVITRDHAKAESYLTRLMREIAIQAELFDRDRVVRQLHLGGGTPNFLDTDQLGALMDALRAGFRFAGEGERELGIEVDPRHADAAYIAALARLGFNRISFGVQDFNPAVQEAINRIQSVEETLEVIAAARSNGFRSINLDLIYGLPRQSLAGFAETLETVTLARPDRIALYSYAHLPQLFKAQRQIEAEDLPSPAAKLELLGTAIAHLTGAGYRYIGMDHFALPDDDLVRAQDDGTLQRNFQGYSTHGDCDLVGLGMTAIGSVGDCYAQNARELVGYYAMLDHGRLPLAKGVVLSDDDRLRRELIGQIMCFGRLDFRTIERRHGLRFAESFAPELARLEALAADGLVALDAAGFEVTPRGRLLLRIVTMAFDAYLTRPAEAIPRYSRVI
jgi:oxygen-independent coproporphyrinogen-3 oxidase